MHKLLVAVLILFASTSAMAETTAHDFTLTGIDGKPMPLSQFEGKALLVVNTASECGYTPQYEGLEQLWNSYKDKGLVVLGVPSNDFGGQEPGTSEDIASFCKLNYGVSFPLADKTVVKGKEAHPLYQWLKEQGGPEGQPKWNFHKYLIGPDGRYFAWFSTQTTPTGPKITSAVRKLLNTD